MVSVTSDQVEAAGAEPSAGSRGHPDGLEVQQVAPAFIVVALYGLGDRALINAAADEVRCLAPTDHIMVNLSGITIVDLVAIEVLVSALDDATGDRRKFCFVCSRLTGRLLLHRSGVADGVPIFATSGDAQQARVHHQEGYGDGWSWSAERRSDQQANGGPPDPQSFRARQDDGRQLSPRP